MALTPVWSAVLISVTLSPSSDWAIRFKTSTAFATEAIILVEEGAGPDLLVDKCGELLSSAQSHDYRAWPHALNTIVIVLIVKDIFNKVNHMRRNDRKF